MIVTQVLILTTSTYTSIFVYFYNISENQYADSLLYRCISNTLRTKIYIHYVNVCVSSCIDVMKL